MFWIKVYDFEGFLEKSLKINDKGEIESLYYVEDNLFFRMTKKTFEFKILKDKISLLEGFADSIFYRYIKKKKQASKSLEIPECTHHLYIENKRILNFSVDKEKVNLWKEKVKK